MKPIHKPVAGALLAALTLPWSAGCRSCERGRPSQAPAPPVSTVPAELATLDVPALAGWPPPAAEPPAVEGQVNRWGTGGALIVRAASGAARLVHRHQATPEYPGLDLVTISPDGTSVAFAVPASGDKVQVVRDGAAGTPFDAVDALLFTMDGRLACKAKVGDRWRLVVDGVSSEPRHAIGDLRLASDGATLVAVEQPAPGSPLAVASYDTRLRRSVLRELAAEEVLLNADASLAAAVVTVDGKKRVSAFSLGAPAFLQEGQPLDQVLAITFPPEGTHIVYAGYQGEDLFLVLGDKLDRLPPGYLVAAPVLNPVRKTVGVVLVTDRAHLHMAFDQQVPRSKGYDGVNDVTFSPDGSRAAYVAEEHGRAFVVVNGAEGPAFDRIVGPRFSPDGAFLVYRARQDGRRFVVVADADGKALRRLPDYEQVYPFTFTTDGRSLAYAVKDGPRLLWKVEELPPRPR